MREKDGLVFDSFNSLSVGHLQQQQQEQEKDKREDSRGRRSRRRRDRSRKRGKEMHKEKAKLLDPGLPCACFLPYLEKERDRKRDATSMSPFFDSKGLSIWIPSLSLMPSSLLCLWIHEGFPAAPLVLLYFFRPLLSSPFLPLFLLSSTFIHFSALSSHPSLRFLSQETDEWMWQKSLM